MAEPLTGASGPTGTVAPVPPLGAPSVAPAEPEPLRLLDLRAILVATLVLLGGAVLGATGYAAEQHYSNWLPKPVRDGSGWRVVDAHGRRFSGLSLSGDHLAWQDGPLVLVMDLASGRIRLLGPGPENDSTWQPAVSQQYVVWFEGRRGRADRGAAYAYDLSTRRRRELATVARPVSYVAASGALAVWSELGSGDLAQLVVLDLGTARRSSVTAKAGEPLIDGDLVAVKWSGSGGEAIAAVDLTTKREWPVVSGNGGAMSGFGLSERRVAWGWADATTGTGRVLVRDVDSGDTTLVATALGLTGPAISGDTVVWAQQAADGSDAVMGRRLSGGPAFRIAAGGGDVEAVQVSDDAVAWLFRDAAGRTVIHTASLR